MKSIKRIVFGVISSLLLAAGFVHAAGGLEPISTHSTSIESDSHGSSPGCANECDIADGE